MPGELKAAKRGLVPEYCKQWDKAKTDADREILRRKFERDKDELRALGIEIVTVQIEGADS